MLGSFHLLLTTCRLCGSACALAFRCLLPATYFLLGVCRILLCCGLYVLAVVVDCVIDGLFRMQGRGASWLDKNRFSCACAV
jgi:hypothetical protein